MSENNFVLRNDAIEQHVVPIPAAMPLTFGGNNSPSKAQGTTENPEIKRVQLVSQLVYKSLIYLRSIITSKYKTKS